MPVGGCSAFCVAFRLRVLLTLDVERPRKWALLPDAAKEAKPENVVRGGRSKDAPTAVRRTSWTAS